MIFSEMRAYKQGRSAGVLDAYLCFLRDGYGGFKP